MALLHQEVAFARSTCVRLQGDDLRYFPAHPPSNNPRVAKRPASCRDHAGVTASRKAQIFSRQMPGQLIQQLTSTRSGCSAQTIFHSFQSDAPLEQQIDAPPPSPKFQPFIPQTGVRQDMLNYRHKVKVAGGSILVRPLTHAWVHECGALLTGAFADAMGYVPMYRTYLRHQIRQYLYRHADMPPKALVLVALLLPEELSGDHTSSSDSDSGSESDLEASTSGQEGEQQNAILVGTVELSFAASTRARYLTLNAPVNCAYLCNMAVDANYRRRGYGNILLDAADEVAQIAGEKDIFLHLRFQDAGPASLYKQAGYMSDKADSVLVRLLGLDRRYLMRKQQR